MGRGASIAALSLACCGVASAALPRPVARAFLDAQIPLAGVGAVVQELGAAHPAFSQQPGKAMNPASTMKLVTTFAALELLGSNYRWKTEVYADAPVRDGTLAGDLIVKGYGDPKMTLEQFAALMARIRAAGISRVQGDLVLDRSYFALPAHDPSAFDAEPLKPYNVGPDALLVNFKSVRFLFAPAADGHSAEVSAEPVMKALTVSGSPRLSDGDCGDWKSALAPTFASRGDHADARFGGSYPASCGEHDWYVALLDHPHYVLGVFERYWALAGGSFSGTVRQAAVPPNARLLVSFPSAPLFEVVRDINKLSNNVMARQVFLTLATTSHAPPATPALAAATVERWLASKKLRFAELTLENGAGLSRRERISAQSMAMLLAAANRSRAMPEFIGSLAVAATDGTVRKRFTEEEVSDHAFLKTGTLEGVRAIAGYVDDAAGKRYVVVCFVNHANAARAQPALDALVQWVYRRGGALQ